jgi:hypothetical protein
MQLSAWLRHQIVINGGALHAYRDGVEILVNLEEIAGELDRRLAGLSYSPRIIVSAGAPAETLSSTASAKGSAAAEILQQSCLTVAHVGIESRKGDNRGRPSKIRAKVMDQMIDGLNTGKYTQEQLATATQEWIKAEFKCHHDTYRDALAEISA